jgi:hypothetical protein
MWGFYIGNEIYQLPRGDSLCVRDERIEYAFVKFSKGYVIAKRLQKNGVDSVYYCFFILFYKMNKNCKNNHNEMPSDYDKFFFFLINRLRQTLS